MPNVPIGREPIVRSPSPVGTVPNLPAFFAAYSFTDKPVFCSAIPGSPSVIGGRSSLEISMLAAGGGWPVRQLPSSPRHHALIALALLLPLLVTIEEQVYMSPAKPSKTAETPSDKLHFLASSLKGNLACSKYLHL